MHSLTFKSAAHAQPQFQLQQVINLSQNRRKVKVKVKVKGVYVDVINIYTIDFSRQSMSSGCTVRWAESQFTLTRTGGLSASGRLTADNIPYIHFSEVPVGMATLPLYTVPYRL